MHRTAALIFALVTILLVVVVIFMQIRWNIYNSTLHGMWRASDEFLEKADLSGMYLYIGDAPHMFTSDRRAYIIMHNEDAILANRRINLTIHNPVGFGSTMERRVTISDIADDSKNSNDTDISEIAEISDTDDIPLSDIMPETLQMHIDLGVGRLSLTDGEELFAEMYKDNFA